MITEQWYHLASLGHNELSCLCCLIISNFIVCIDLSISILAYIAQSFLFATYLQKCSCHHNFVSGSVHDMEAIPHQIYRSVFMLRLIQYIPRNMHTVFALLCFVVVIHWLIFPYPSGLLHWHCGNLTIAPVPAKQHWWIWINTSCEFIMNDCITTTKQSTTKPCAYFLGYTVPQPTNPWY